MSIQRSLRLGFATYGGERVDGELATVSTKIMTKKKGD